MTWAQQSLNFQGATPRLDFPKKTSQLLLRQAQVLELNVMPENGVRPGGDRASCCWLQKHCI